jgi:hypothetical protein
MIIASPADATYVSECGHLIVAATVAPILTVKDQVLRRVYHHV